MRYRNNLSVYVYITITLLAPICAKAVDGECIAISIMRRLNNSTEFFMLWDSDSGWHGSGPDENIVYIDPGTKVTITASGYGGEQPYSYVLAGFANGQPILQEITIYSYTYVFSAVPGESDESQRDISSYTLTVDSGPKKFHIWEQSDSPGISVSTVKLSQTCQEGEDADSQTFKVWNGGEGTLSYTIEDNQDWLSCKRTSGDGKSTGETDKDTITVSYESSDLEADTYTAEIIISSDDASNSPQTIGVTLTVHPPDVVSIQVLQPSENIDSDGQVNIKWESSNATSQATVTLLYDKDQVFNNDNETQIIDGQAADGQYSWNTTNVNSGQYRICAVIEDGDASGHDYSAGKVTISDGEFEILSVEAEYYGVFPEGIDIDNEFTCNVCWGDKTSSHVVFEFNGDDIEISTNNEEAKIIYNMGADLAYSAAGTKNTLLIYAVSADGTKSNIERIYLWGLQLPEWATSRETQIGPITLGVDPLTGTVWFSGDVEVLKNGIKGNVEIPQKVPEIGGKWGVELEPLTFSWKLQAQPNIKGTGLEGLFDLSGSLDGSIAVGKDRKAELGSGISGKGQFYPEFRLTEVSAEFEVGIPFQLPKIYFLCGTPVLCCTSPCPYFQGTVTPEIRGSLSLQQAENTEDALIAGLKFKNSDVSLAGTIAGTVGIGNETVGHAAGTFGGKPYVTLQFPPDSHSFCLNEYVKEAGATLEASWVVEVFGVKIQHKWGPETIYQCPENGQYSSADYMVVDPPQFISRDYLYAPEGYCSIQNVIQTQTMSGDSLPGPIENVGTQPLPSIGAIQNEGIMAFVRDGLKAPGSHQEICCMDWQDGQWTTQSQLTENNSPDTSPVAAIDSSGTRIVAWVNAGQSQELTFTSTEILSGCDIMFSTCLEGSDIWGQPQEVTNNSYADIMPWFDDSPAGVLRLCWLSSKTNAIPVWPDDAVAPSVDILAADWDGGSFDEPYTIASDLPIVSRPSICLTPENELLVYVRDIDTNSATTSDRRVYWRARPIDQSWWGPHQMLTNRNESWDDQAQIAADDTDSPVIVWVRKPLSDTGMQSMDQLWFATQDGDSWKKRLAFRTNSITELKMVRTGMGKLLLFWVGPSDEFTDIYCSAYSSQAQMWGPPQQLTHDTGAETMLTCAEKHGNVIIGYNKRRMKLDTVSGLPEIGYSDLYVKEFSTEPNISISPKDVWIRYDAHGFNQLYLMSEKWLEQIEDNEEPYADLDSNHDGHLDFKDFADLTKDYDEYSGYSEIRADVHLAGACGVRDINVLFYDGQPDSGTLIGTRTIEWMLPGETRHVRIPWHVPDDNEVHTVHIRIETDQGDAPEVEIQAFKPNLKADNFVLLESSDTDAVQAGFSVSNNGDANSGSFICCLYEDNADGPRIHEEPIDNLNPGETQVVKYDWDISGKDSGLYTLLLCVDEVNEVSEWSEDDNTRTALIPILPDLEVEQLSAHITDGNACVRINNIGSRAMPATVIQIRSGNDVLQEATIEALDSGSNIEACIPLSSSSCGTRIEVMANPDSDGTDEITLLNNSAIVLVPSDLVTDPCDPNTEEDMTLIEGGEFQMGDPNGDYTEIPHMVKVDSFLIDKHEVSNREYCEFLNASLSAGTIHVGADGVVYGAGEKEYCKPEESQIVYDELLEEFRVIEKAGATADNYPAVTITWYGAVAYCNWLTEGCGYELCYDLGDWSHDLTKTGYRLPTEAEWEYAARCDLTGNRFPWGNEISHENANYDAPTDGPAYDLSAGQGWHPDYELLPSPYTAPVDAFSQGDYQLCSIVGNVREWCNDRYGSMYYHDSPYDNPEGPDGGNDRVYRGGGYNDGPEDCRVFYRWKYNPNSAYINQGFRVVRRP